MNPFENWKIEIKQFSFETIQNGLDIFLGSVRVRVRSNQSNYYPKQMTHPSTVLDIQKNNGWWFSCSLLTNTEIFDTRIILFVGLGFMPGKFLFKKGLMVLHMINVIISISLAVEEIPSKRRVKKYTHIFGEIFVAICIIRPLNLNSSLCSMISNLLFQSGSGNCIIENVRMRLIWVLNVINK